MNSFCCVYKITKNNLPYLYPDYDFLCPHHELFAKAHTTTYRTNSEHRQRMTYEYLQNNIEVQTSNYQRIRPNKQDEIG